MNILLEAAGAVQAILGSPLFMFVIIIAIMYFMMIRPQRKRQKEIENFRRGLRAGQDIITSGGIYGKIKNIDDTTVTIEVCNNVTIRVDKNSVYASPAAIQQQEGK
ncbi:MAG: preprotein translocase subunit YajC [Bacteroidaceae bacterium]|nr:preprotein translocase subunit YajC [Bacteroidaceae bacterium]